MRVLIEEDDGEFCPMITDDVYEKTIAILHPYFGDMEEAHSFANRAQAALKHGVTIEMIRGPNFVHFEIVCAALGFRYGIGPHISGEAHIAWSESHMQTIAARINTEITNDSR